MSQAAERLAVSTPPLWAPMEPESPVVGAKPRTQEPTLHAPEPEVVLIDSGTEGDPIDAESEVVLLEPETEIVHVEEEEGKVADDPAGEKPQVAPSARSLKTDHWELHRMGDGLYVARKLPSAPKTPDPA